jgi:hypothetical protein
VLENLDLPGQRRLGHVEPRGGAPEMQLFGNRNKAAELVQVEHRCVTRMNEAFIRDF